MVAGPRILSDLWYAEYLGESCLSAHQAIRRRCPVWLARLAERVPVIRGLVTFWIGKSCELIVTTGGSRQHPEGWIILFLEALFSRHVRRVILLEFIRSVPGYKQRSTSSLVKRAGMGVEGILLRRVVRAAHVMTSWERDLYSNAYGIPVNRFHYVPWPQRWAADEFPSPPDTGEDAVVSTGRTACDWETLFKAAAGRNWAPTIVCGRRDFSVVNRLNRSTRAQVHCEISSDEHDKIVRSATVYVLCLREEEMSIGQMRVMSAIRAGVPIVATRVAGLQEYLTDGETALLVPPGDYLALRNAIETLLLQGDERRRLSGRAFELARERTFEHYLAELRSLAIGGT